MNNSTELSDKSHKRRKQRAAAYKAWRTIRQQRREKVAETVRRIDEYILPAKVGRIRHPERIKSAKAPKRYGNGLICQFSKTPSKIVCGRFWELRWAFGCPFNCAYCYLRGTRRGNMTPRYVKLETILSLLDEVFNDPEFNNRKPAFFNSGELCDSLMKPDYMSAISDKFEEQKRHKLILVTKFGPCNATFLTKKPRKNTIVVWSINTPEVARRWEIAAPAPSERISAAKMVSEAGYDVRVRIDPIFPIKHWKVDYASLSQQILSNFTPHRIILGTPRGLWKTFHYAKKAGVDMSWTQFFAPEETGWGRKLPMNQRIAIYKFMYDRLAIFKFPQNQVSICKETRELYERLGVKYEPLTCQCYSR